MGSQNFWRAIISGRDIVRNAAWFTALKISSKKRRTFSRTFEGEIFKFAEKWGHVWEEGV